MKITVSDLFGNGFFQGILQILLGILVISKVIC